MLESREMRDALLVRQGRTDSRLTEWGVFVKLHRNKDSPRLREKI